MSDSNQSANIQELPITEQIAKLAPPNAYQYCLNNVLTSARIPAEPGQFLIATPAIAWPRGVQDGTYHVEFFDAKGLLLGPKNPEVAPIVYVSMAVYRRPPVSMVPQSQAVAIEAAPAPSPPEEPTYEDRWKNLRVWDAEERTRQNAEIRESVTLVVRDVSEGMRDTVVKAHDVVNAAHDVAEQRLKFLEAMENHHRQSVKNERESAAQIWKEIEELRKKAKPDYAPVLASLGTSLIQAGEGIWTAYLLGKRKRGKKKTKHLLDLLKTMVDGEALEELLDNPEAAKELLEKLAKAAQKKAGAEAPPDAAAAPSAQASAETENT